MENPLFDENVCEWWEIMKKKKYKIFKTEELYEKKRNGGHGKYVGERSRENRK